MDGWEEPCSKKQTLPSFYGLTFIFVSKFVFIINIINTAPPHLLQTCYNCWANGNTCTVTHEKWQNGSQNVQYTVNTLKIVSSLFLAADFSLEKADLHLTFFLHPVSPYSYMADFSICPQVLWPVRCSGFLLMRANRVLVWWVVLKGTSSQKLHHVSLVQELLLQESFRHLQDIKQGFNWQEYTNTGTLLQTHAMFTCIC